MKTLIFFLLYQTTDNSIYISKLFVVKFFFSTNYIPTPFLTNMFRTNKNLKLYETRFSKTLFFKELKKDLNEVCYGIIEKGHIKWKSQPTFRIHEEYNYVRLLALISYIEDKLTELVFDLSGKDERKFSEFSIKHRNILLNHKI